MKIIQRLFLKFLAASITLSLSTFQPSPAQTSSFRLKTADSLFQAKRYTQSLEHYEEILRQRQYSPAMLLKMAYIHEGLNQIGSAMFYLNLYHIATNDKSALTKMDELANKFDLEGYETSDTDRFWAFYVDHHLNLSLGLAAIIILMLAIMYRNRAKYHTRPITPGIILVFFSILLLAHQLYGTRRSRGITANPSTYLMAGPSAGATVIDIVGDGHRVEVLGKNDVWMKIKWEDDVAYVKQNALRPVRL